MAGCVMARRVGGHQQPIAESCNPRGAPTGDGPFWRSSNGCGSSAPCRTTVLCFWGDLGWFGRKIACRAFLCRLPVRRLRGEFQLANVSRRRTFRFGRRLSSLRELQREFRASCEFGRIWDCVLEAGGGAGITFGAPGFRFPAFGRAQTGAAAAGGELAVGRERVRERATGERDATINLSLHFQDRRGAGSAQREPGRGAPLAGDAAEKYPV